MSWNLALQINKLASITRVSGSSILIYNSTGTLLASYATTGLFLGDATLGSSSAGGNNLTLPSYGSITWAGITATPPSILTGGGANIYTRAGVAFNQNYAGTEKGQTDFALFSQVVTGSVPSIVSLTSGSPIYQINTNSSSTQFRLPTVTSGVTPVGTFFIFNNNGGANATIANVSAGLLHTVAGGATVKAILLDNTTAPDGTWEITSELPNTVNWGTSGATFSGDLNATNLNGKLGIVGASTASGNVVLCNNTSNTSGNFDLQTDSDQHLTFSGGTGAGSNVLSVGGATNGAITVPSTAGTITMATTGSIICNNYSNNGDNNLNITAFSSGNTPAITFNSRSINSSTAIGRWGFVNNTGWNFEDGVSGGLQSTLCGVNSNGFFINNTAYIINGAKMNALVGGSRFASGDLVIYPNAGGSLNVIGANMALRTGSQLVLYRPDEANFWTVGVNSGSQWVVSQSGGFAMYLLSGTAQTLWSNTSDERLKENIVPVGTVSSTLMKLQVKSYNYKSHPDALKSIGFIAQDIQQIPELVDIMVNESPDKAEDGTNYLGVNQSVLTPYLVKAFQEQQAELTDLKAQLASLKATVDALVAQKEILVV